MQLNRSSTDARTYRESPDVMYESSLEALAASNFKLLEDSPQDGMIRGQKRINLLTWGEDVEVLIEGQDDRTEVTFRSQSRGSLLDWGTNGRNVRKFFKELDEALAETLAGS